MVWLEGMTNKHNITVFIFIYVCVDWCLFFGGYDRIAYIEFATEAIADNVFEEAQGSDVKGNSIVIDYMGKKSTALLGQLLYNLVNAQVWSYGLQFTVAFFMTSSALTLTVCFLRFRY